MPVTVTGPKFDRDWNSILMVEAVYTAFRLFDAHPDQNGR